MTVGCSVKSDVNIFLAYDQPHCSVRQLRRGKRDNLGIISHISPLKHTL